VLEKLYSLLIRSYPREFRERFGTSMRQNYRDICGELGVHIYLKLLRIGWLFAEAAISAVREHLNEIRRGCIMKKGWLGPRAALVIGTLMALPMMIIFPVALLNIEPFNGYMSNALSDPNGRQHLGGLSAIIVAMLLLPAGGILAMMPAIRSSRSGAGMLSYKSNVLIGSLLFLFGFGLWAMLFIDQVPCMMGVPNCD